MDLLCTAYSTASDDDDDGVRSEHPSSATATAPPPKRAKFDVRKTNPIPSPMPVYRPIPAPNLPTEAPIPGRYISKRERAALASATKAEEPNPPHPVDSPLVIGSLSQSDIPYSIITSLKHQVKGVTENAQIPRTLSIALNGHTKSVNTLQWSSTHAHLLASAGMDHICIWNVWSRDQKKARILKFQKAAVKDVKWSQQGLFVLCCGYDCMSRLIDVEKGSEVQTFAGKDQSIEVVKFHPQNFNVFLSGGSKGLLKLWDIRSSKVVHEYVRNLGPILDVEFMVDGKQLITSSDVSKSNLSESSIVVWDVSRQIPLSNQVYTEAYTCPAIRCHPSEPYFIAQSNGNYIAIFSSQPPFRLDKYRRYESHGVSGFPVKCNFSSDGEIVVSGSSDGCVYFYNSKTSELLRKIKAYEQACIDAVYHPVMPNVVATCSWNGEVSVFN